MRLWVDDERPAPEGWTLAHSAVDAMRMLREEKVTEVSLDHDLGGEGTGYDVLLWIEEQVFLRPEYWPPQIKIHTANSSARIKMELAVKAIERELQSRPEGARAADQ